MIDPKYFEWPCTDDAPIHNGNGNYFDYEPIQKRELEDDEEIPDEQPEDEPL
jgi:hypothetical protein